MPYDILTPAKMIIGPGSLSKLGESVAEIGRHALVVTGRKAMRQAGVTRQIRNLLELAGVRVELFENVEPEPSCETCDSIREIIRSRQCDVVVGVGGGSAMDAAKTAAGLAGEDAPAVEFWLGRTVVTHRGVAFVAVPTVAGTGAEATRNAVITNVAVPAKSSIRDDSFVAKLVVVDPYLMLSVSPIQTAWSGMDALVQAVEAFVSRHANAVTDAWALESVRNLKNSVPAAFENGADLFARSEAAIGSLLSGLALSNARLGLAHGLAHPLGARHRVPHGLACGVLLPHVIRFNRASCAAKYAELDAVFGVESAAFVEDFRRRLKLPDDLKAFNVRPEDVGLLVQESLPSGSLKANPRTATPEACAEIPQCGNLRPKRS